jgi:hypothetical protein
MNTTSAPLYSSIHLTSGFYISRIIRRYGLRRTEEILAEIASSEEAVAAVLKLRAKESRAVGEWWKEPEV